MLFRSVLQMLIALNSSEMPREKRALRLFRLQYSLLAVVSAVLSLEAIAAIASVEGGIYLAIPSLPRYVAALPGLLYLYSLTFPAKLPPSLRPLPLSFFIPLLRLPPMDGLPSPLATACAVFAAVWLLLDAVRMLWSFKAYARMEVTRGVMAHIIRGIGHGICVANRSGWILETNPAFDSFCMHLGIHKAERVEELDASLKALCDDRRLQVADLESGQSIRSGDSVFFLQRSSFKAGRKAYTHLALSDVTAIHRTASELEGENEQLAQKNRELEAAISETEQEEIVRARERLCRAAHDQWSQRLAVAGLSIDMLLDRQDMEAGSGHLEELARTLEDPASDESWQTDRDLTETLRDFNNLYKKLGVEIQISGQADFAGREQAVLYAVMREALANAVRHAYARHIHVRLDENADTKSVTILNQCLDDKTDIAVGRGLHDIIERVRQANGSVQYQKSRFFELKITFDKPGESTRRRLRHESRAD